MTQSDGQERTLIRDISFCGVANGANACMVDVEDGRILRIRPMHYDWKYERRRARSLDDEGPGQDASRPA